MSPFNGVVVEFSPGAKMSWSPDGVKPGGRVRSNHTYSDYCNDEQLGGIPLRGVHSGLEESKFFGINILGRVLHEETGGLD